MARSTIEASTPFTTTTTCNSALSPADISIVDGIVQVISRYLNCDDASDQFQSVGCTRLIDTVSRYVQTGEQMELVFPAFPFKSTSLKKVLGELPDLGEEILLTRLEMLARDISEYHAPGAVIRLVSDGLVYQGQLVLCNAGLLLTAGFRPPLQT